MDADSSDNVTTPWGSAVSPPESRASQPAEVPSTMGPGPRACVNCATAKAKCIFLSENSTANGKCRRCDRLNKECILQTPAVRKRKPPKVTRVAQLEEKLDGIVSLLKSSQKKSPGSASPAPAVPNVVHESMPSSLMATETMKWPITPPQSTPQPCGLEPSFRIPNIQVPSHQELFRSDPDSLLTLYRVYMNDQFPFVVIPMEMTANDLQQQKPFLLKVILMVASVRDMAGQTRMAEAIMEHVAQNMILRGEKSLDLLQGLLVFIAWYHYHIHLARRLTVLMQLATALLIDLGLNGEYLATAKSDQSTLQAFPEDMPQSNTRTLEGRRAFLGLTYITSIVSVYVKHMDALRFTKYADICCRSLEEHAQYPSDEILIQLIRLQHISEQVQDALPHEDQFDLTPNTAAPVALCVKILHNKLNKIQSSLPPHLQQNVFLLMHYHSTLIFLNEMALRVPVASRQAALHTCLTSIQAFLSLLGSIRTEESFKFTYCYWTQLTHILIVLGKVSCFECEEWDLRYVREVLDLSFVLEGFIARFEITLATRGDSELYRRIIPKFKQYKEVFERKRASVMREDDFMASNWQQTQHHQPTQAEDNDPIPDEAFWQELMGDWGNGWH
ncbi:hypothetical protein BP6252_03516 [Coleophoma cylindrospora]|uniref:Zn(2)-C6 fungal-type domain-containing protein n=1 Tax=Coleophoma cylindrospora TaxID=1849047 RepID=A0A3D8S8I5_9HELO|nr:hypothetical protein BP6252_03516 [Coleophoma cylindrospora]